MLRSPLTLVWSCTPRVEGRGHPCPIWQSNSCQFLLSSQKNGNGPGSAASRSPRLTEAGDCNAAEKKFRGPSGYELLPSPWRDPLHNLKNIGDFRFGAGVAFPRPQFPDKVTGSASRSFLSTRTKGKKSPALRLADKGRSATTPPEFLSFPI